MFLFVIIIVSIVLVGCKSSSTEDEILDFKKVYKLKHSFYKEVILKNPQIEMTDSFIVLLSVRNSEDVCKVFSKCENLEEVCAYGNIGEGPKEFRQPVLTDATDNTFGINEINEMQYVKLAIKQMDDKVEVYEKERYKAKYMRMEGEEYTPKDTRYMPLMNGHYYVSCFFLKDGSFFTLSDSLLRPLTRFGQSPIKEELPTRSIRNRLNGLTDVYDNRFFYATSELPYLASYTLKDNRMDLDWEIYYKKPHYGVVNGEVRFDKEKSTGPLNDMRAGSRYIYLLYMDQLLYENDYYQTEKSCSNKIFVFNHQGDKVACLELDNRLSRMAIDEKRGKIYGIAHIPDVGLIEYDMPKELWNCALEN